MYNCAQNPTPCRSGLTNDRHRSPLLPLKPSRPTRFHTLITLAPFHGGSTWATHTCEQPTDCRFDASARIQRIQGFRSARSIRPYPTPKFVFFCGLSVSPVHAAIQLSLLAAALRNPAQPYAPHTSHRSTPPSEICRSSTETHPSRTVSPDKDFRSVSETPAFSRSSRRRS